MASRGLVWAGVAAALAGVTVGGASLVTGAFVRAATVEGFARAPAGCTTELEFDEADTFTLYAETKGRIEQVEGDCTLRGSYEHSGDLPEITLTMVGDAAGEVPLGQENDFSYDTQDFRGTSYATVVIERTGVYRLTVASGADDVVVAIGRDPERDSLVWVAAGMTIAVLGMAIGLVLLVLGLRRRTPPTWAADGAPVTTAPWGPPPWPPPPSPPPPSPPPPSLGS